MSDFVFFFPIIVLVIAFVVAGAIPTVRAFLKEEKIPLQKKDRSGYQREVDAIHITSDAATERQRRLDQLKSLYEAGMMERDEYWERRENVEADYR